MTSRSWLVPEAMRPARRKSCRATTSLMTCSLSASVGFTRAMSDCSVASRWLARGSTWSLNQTMKRVSTLAARITGTMRRRALTPLALNAVISFSAARREKACSVATSTAIGSVIASVKGIESERNSAMTVQGSPLPTRSPNRLATKFRRRSEVSAERAKRSGPACSRRM